MSTCHLPSSLLHFISYLPSFLSTRIFHSFTLSHFHYNTIVLSSILFFLIYVHKDSNAHITHKVNRDSFEKTFKALPHQFCVVIISQIHNYIKKNLYCNVVVIEKGTMIWPLDMPQGHLPALAGGITNISISSSPPQL